MLVTSQLTATMLSRTQVNYDGLGVDALVARNANAAMLAELWSHPNASGDPAVFVTMGSGIGVAVQVSGQFCTG